MTADTTNAQGLHGAAPAAPAGPSHAERAEHVVERIEHAAGEAWTFLRFLLFVLYLLIAALAFWLWVMTAVVGLIRLVFKVIMVVLLWLSGGLAPPQGTRPPTLKGRLLHEWTRVRDLRLAAHDEIVRPLQKHLKRTGRAAAHFWHWSFFRKAFTVVAVFWLVIVPALYIIPRPHHVQITDDNALVYDASANQTTYLIHALDLSAHNKTREYINVDAWYLGKINSQGLKSRLQHGRTYRLWVVGIRWYYMPRLYPNIISATEIDAHGKEVEHPARLAAPAQAQAQPPQ
jgi:hypothetical protein